MHRLHAEPHFEIKTLLLLHRQMKCITNWSRVLFKQQLFIVASCTILTQISVSSAWLSTSIKTSEYHVSPHIFKWKTWINKSVTASKQKFTSYTWELRLIISQEAPSQEAPSQIHKKQHKYTPLYIIHNLKWQSEDFIMICQSLSNITINLLRIIMELQVCISSYYMIIIIYHIIW